jgi:hypothetical protein
VPVYHKELTVYFYSLEPVRFFDGGSKEFLAGHYPLQEVLETIKRADPASEAYRIKEDLFGGETFCLVHDDGPQPILGAYYRDNLARPLAEYKGEITELMLREGEALVDAAYAAFFPNDVVGLVRTSSKSPGFARIGQWLTYLGGYGCGLFALRDANALAQLDRDPLKLRSFYLRMRRERISGVEGYSRDVAQALRAASDLGGPSNDDVAIELRSRRPKSRAQWARHIRQEIEELLGVLPDFEEAKVKVAGARKAINLLRTNIQRPVRLVLLDSKRVGPSEAADAMFQAYEEERASIELAVEATRPRGSSRDPLDPPS